VEDPELIEAAATTALLAHENMRLARDAARTHEELRLSRARIARTNDVEMHRIERKLHEGAQQRLLAMRVRLALLDPGPSGSPLAAALTELQADLDEAIAALRSVAHDIYPQLLADYGLADALGAVSIDTEGAVEVDGEVGRFPPEIESAVYHCCVDAVRAASGRLELTHRIKIQLSELPAGGLSFAVSWPGFGAEQVDLVAYVVPRLEDRIGAFDGRIDLSVSPHGVLRLAGVLPDARPSEAASAPEPSGRPRGGSNRVSELPFAEAGPTL
jgi:signal transduction histidine kinase